MSRRRTAPGFSATRLALVAVSLLAYGLNVFGYPLLAPRAAAPVAAEVTEASESGDTSAAPKRCGCRCGPACAGGTECCCKPHAPESKPPETPPPEAPPEPAPAAAPTGVAWVNGVQARSCRGEATEWVTQGAALPSPLLVTWSFEWTPQGVASSALPSLASVTLDRTTPPPRPV